MTLRAPIYLSLAKFPRLPALREAGSPVFEFHILAAARDSHEFDQELFSLSGNVIFPDFHAVRVFAQKMNVRRQAGKFPERAVRAGHLNAMGLIDEILHYVFRLYEETANPGVFGRAIGHLEQRAGEGSVRNTLKTFGLLYPPRHVYARLVGIEEYFTQKTGDKPNTEIALEEMILLFFANINPAFEPFKELFDDEKLSSGTAYRKMMDRLEEFFRTQKKFGPDNQYMFDLLRAPILASPHSLEGQLEFIRKQWGLILSDKFLRRIPGAGDLLKEDDRILFPQGAAGAPTIVPEYPPWNMAGSERGDAERFTADLDWMPRVVVLAKNTYVWLDQLSKKYRREISRLDQIPDEELDQLARWNITGLWLIGIWERSPASQRIKQMTGNPEAVASAYSIYDYEIAGDLGGEEAFLNLRRRAWQRGLRMAGDMVPNHMGIYSKWVVERPEYFMQSDFSPFPNYTFTGANLSAHPGVDIRIEDGYWERRDAAVVFQHVERGTGRVHFIYHGNDGTNMPWNDTAQLDFLKAEVREAVIQTILHVAQKFSIIRFDAAMTLTKQHFQRLWYPQPGSGGDIPSRADHAMTKEEFDRAFPAEFWREVVDRINAEMPDTLLLAEAFWLLEGYFVRTLGMHRVYNSAFMHMLMKEENAKYRALIKNTLAFNPEILRRYVNFMSNPDEQTAIAQFGKDDRYFGVALLMVTLPGLPMFAHGQIEGYTEKYGMEYKRAYYDERPDEELIRRHERELFPLMQKRALFSGVENFELYDLVGTDGAVNENVFAYSNRVGGDRALVCYHNRYEECAGWIRTAVPKVQSGGGEKELTRRNLAEALALDSADRTYCLFKERTSGLEFIRSCKDLRDSGLYVELRAFQSQVFTDFREVYDESGDYYRLAGLLKGGGVPDLNEALLALRLKPVHEAVSAMLDPEALDQLKHLIRSRSSGPRAYERELASLAGRYEHFVRSVRNFLGSSAGAAGRTGAGDIASPLAAHFREDLEGLIVATRSSRSRPTRNRRTAKGGQAADHVDELRLIVDSESTGDQLLFLAWISTHRLGGLLSEIDVPRQSETLFDTLMIEPVIDRILEVHQTHGSHGRQGAGLLRILIRFADLFSQDAEDEVLRGVRAMLDDELVKRSLRVNVYEGEVYYNKESLETVLDWLFLTAMVRKAAAKPGAATRESIGLQQRHSTLLKIKTMSGDCGYRLQGLRNALAVSHPTIEEQTIHH